MPDFRSQNSLVMLSEAVRRAKRASLRSRSIPTLKKLHTRLTWVPHFSRVLCARSGDFRLESIATLPKLQKLRLHQRTFPRPCSTMAVRQFRPNLETLHAQPARLSLRPARPNGFMPSRYAKRPCTASTPPISTAKPPPAMTSTNSPTAPGARTIPFPRPWPAGASAGRPANPQKIACTTF